MLSLPKALENFWTNEILSPHSNKFVFVLQILEGFSYVALEYYLLLISSFFPKKFFRNWSFFCSNACMTIVHHVFAGYSHLVFFLELCKDHRISPKFLAFYRPKVHYNESNAYALNVNEFLPRLWDWRVSTIYTRRSWEINLKNIGIFGLWIHLIGICL